MYEDLSLHDTEDKKMWCAIGTELECDFLDNIVPALCEPIIFNPEKKHNKYAIDFLNQKTNTLFDLKTHQTPFYLIGKLYKIDGLPCDPNYVFPLDGAQYKRYKESGKDIGICFWINVAPNKFEGFGIKTTPACGVYYASFKYLENRIDAGRYPLHVYKKRNDGYQRLGRDMKGNAQDGFMIDVRHMKRLL